tara:strand:- start:872 stop:1354 length:483 start_codon:yes stop_codon:yes gene_type:complete
MIIHSLSKFLNLSLEVNSMQDLKNDCIYHAIEKIEEIQEDLFNFPCTSNWLTIGWGELHYYLFNEDYFLIGYYNCKKWLGDNLLNAINLIKDYELFNFGEVSSDLSSSEDIANMTAYILGEEILSESKIFNCLGGRLYEKIRPFELDLIKRELLFKVNHG